MTFSKKEIDIDEIESIIDYYFSPDVFESEEVEETRVETYR